MAGGGRREVPDDLDEVLRRIEHWRKTRRKRGAMPEKLWAEAVAMAGRHGVWLASHVLRVNYASLKARLERAHGAEAEGRISGGDRARGSGFVELKASQLGALSDPAGVVVELSSADGARLVIRTPGHEGLDLRGLADAFWRRGA
ncbi:hypothetical protein ACFL59_13940 [Planctomycetota bacterium]